MEETRTNGLGHAQIRLGGLHDELYAIVSKRLARYRLQMTVVELRVQARTGVDYASIDTGADRDRSGPVFRRERDFERTYVHVGHGHEAPLAQSCTAAFGIFESHGAM